MTRTENDLDPQDALEKFLSHFDDGKQPGAVLSFFVGYAHGAAGARENFDAILRAFEKARDRTP